MGSVLVQKLTNSGYRHVALVAVFNNMVTPRLIHRNSGLLFVCGLPLARMRGPVQKMQVGQPRECVHGVMT